MLRIFVRVSGVLGLAALVLVAAASVLAESAARLNATPAGRVRSESPAVSVDPNFAVTVSAVVTRGLTNPVDIVHAGDGSGRLFVVEQRGYIRVVKNGVLSNTPYLTLTGKVSCCGERGLLSIAFDPAYNSNGTFYVYYTAQNGDVTIERYVAANPASDVANISSSKIILSVAHPDTNHNGGQLQFGPDGYLYAGLGDGGGAGDQHGTIGNGQDPTELLGKILRLNVQGVPTYTIPASNPFAQTAGYRPEIWALGLRNPWRFSFDRGTGDLYIGDVGQDCFEEIDYQPAASPGGENYGWRVMEGFHQFDPADMSNCNQPLITPAGITRPIAEYQHPSGEAVTGGYVYRGQAYPWLSGWYFYGDYQTGLMWVTKQTQPGVWSGAQILPSGLTISSFGEDELGEMYVTDYARGRIYKITSAAPIDFSGSTKKASSGTALAGNVLTYTIVVRNTGKPVANTVRVTDVIPVGLSYVPGSFKATHGQVDPAAVPVLKWSGVMSPTSVVTLTYLAAVATSANRALINEAIVDPGENSPLVRSAVVIANPRRLFLPVIRRGA
jgi:uncharacterized repeat protein (TIGR01451 family)